MVAQLLQQLKGIDAYNRCEFEIEEIDGESGLVNLTISFHGVALTIDAWRVQVVCNSDICPWVRKQILSLYESDNQCYQYSQKSEKKS